ncbi:MAG: ABC transporter permease subunit [Solobacterium sp.]|nr:ABC transporter permease subunit [Solobacterium sp.]
MSENKRKGKHLLLGQLFRNRNREVDLMIEEQIQSPGRMMLDNFLHNRLGMIGLIGFLAIFLFVTIAPHFVPIDLGQSDATQTNIPPTTSMMKLPDGLKNNVQAIAPGPTFGVGCDKDGNIYTWGYTKITDKIDIKNIPDKVKDSKIVDVAAGYDHIVALDEDNDIYVWGNTRLGQDRIPTELKTGRHGRPDIIQIEAGYQMSGAVTADGRAYFWGNSNMTDIDVKKDLQGHIKKIAIATYNYICLLDDGSVAYGGLQKTNAFTNIPANLKSGVVDIAASGDTMAAVTEDGKITVWGNITHHENEIPEFDSKPVEIYGGRYHYTALMENGDVISWGGNDHNQATVPDSVNTTDIETVYAGFYQNYAVTKTGSVETWGLKGHPLGTDDLGRDILTRIIHGGKTTMTVGAIAEIISIIIGVVLGALAGYFGGKTDLIIMRISEIIGGLPFLPFALLLSAIIGTRIDVQLRMYLIMVVLGLLSWTGICRLIRAQILAEREKEFVIAAQAMGVKEHTIIFKHILPNVMSILLVQATLGFATCMLTESSLSYLGFGITPPTPTWGNMLTGANNSIVIQQYWWRWVFPASIFGICTICINLMGDAIRDAVDPKSLGR